MDYGPVCGSDGKTYSNECMMRGAACITKKKLTISHHGICEPKALTDECAKPCPADYEPVCGTDGQTYGNQCMMEYQACKTKSKLVVEYKGACEDIAVDPTEGCDEPCPLIYNPVCGSDDKTYDNECALNREACRQASALRVQYKGFCAVAVPYEAAAAPDEDCLAICPLDYRPVCGTDGTTYGNDCLLKYQACKTKKKLTKHHDGECKMAAPPGDDKCEEACTLDYNPICGSDGKTYSNECNMRVAACKTKKKLTKHHDGECKMAAPPGDDTCEEACTLDYNPICGSDGKTYSNQCNMRVAACKTKKKLTKHHDGECKMAAPPGDGGCEEACTLDYNPICGSDSKTYSNQCNMRVAACKSKKKIKKDYEGECKVAVPYGAEDDCDEHCNMNYLPVCGSDGKTYSNECEMRVQACRTKQDIKKVHDGECKTAGAPSSECDMHCPLDYNPICASDGKTYANECLMRAQACRTKTVLKKAYDGVCKESDRKEGDECDVVCPLNYDPVCGSDGNTYGNECLMRLRACKSKKRISKAYDGECRVAAPGSAADSCKMACPRDYNPVCGSDGNTYDNECLLRVQACKIKRDIKVEHQGACVAAGEGSDECNPVCPEIYSPVCGTDGKTYDNDCLLRYRACRLKKQIRVLHQGECKAPERRSDDDCDRKCPKIYKPVCGTDGVTYSNECLLKVAACRGKKSIKVRYQGPCTDVHETDAGKDCDEFCPLTYDPVCGSDGKTYDNHCLLDYQACKSGASIKIKHKGSCKQGDEMLAGGKL